MLRTFFIIIFCFFSVQNDEPTIIWSDSYKLSWDDFKGKPNESFGASAVTASGISFKYSIKQSTFRVVSFTAQVQACFYPEKSWYKPQLVNSHVLGHEQLHYDITELYARKFRKHLALLKPSKTLKQELDALQESINKDLSNRQNEYDEKTNYSRNIEMQRYFQKLIDLELDELNDFKSE